MRQLRGLGYSESSIPVIMLYNEICVPHGFWPVSAFSQKLEIALLDRASCSVHPGARS
jgi:hypothetical protein